MQPSLYPSPRQFGLPHDTWRQNQYESYLWLKKNFDNKKEFSVLEQAVGCGKSAVVTALGTTSRVLVLVSTLGLGKQYEREYGYTFLPGRQEFSCIDSDKIEEWGRMGLGTPTAFDCHYPSMQECSLHNDCPYILAREEAKKARKVCLTYKYASLAQWPKDRNGILICDEAHGLAEELLDLGQFQIAQWDVDKFHLPSLLDTFPRNIQGAIEPENMETVTGYIANCYRATVQYVGIEEPTPHELQGLRKHKAIGHFLDTLYSTPYWFIDAGPQAISSWDRQRGRRKYYAGLVLRPLDAAPAAATLWDKKQMAVLMSATIGNPKPLAQELGIKHFEHRVVPHVIPVEKRPVYSIFDERMTKKNLDKYPGLYRTQAIAISHWINSLPPEWRGIILTTSYKKIHKLREYLDIGDRLWMPPTRMDGSWEKVTGRIQAFLEDPREGIVSVDTLSGWGHGLDLRGDLGRFVVVAGVQFPNPSDPYDVARQKRPGGKKYLNWLAHCGSMQACGRVTRGLVVDGEYLLNVAAIADGSAMTGGARRSYSDWFVEAMQ